MTMSFPGNDVIESGQVLEGKALFGMAQGELARLMEASGQPKYRAAQLGEALYKQRVERLEEMTVLPGALREALAARGFRVGLPEIVQAARSVDGSGHSVQLYVDASAELAVNINKQAVVWGTSRVGDLTVMHVGTNAQPMLQKAGDKRRMDWGWGELAVPAQAGMQTATIGSLERDHDV